MPKIIENLSADIIDGALRIIEKEGIERLNIRRLSAELGIAASTIYNYYENKEAIVGAAAMVMWNRTLEAIDDLCSSEMSGLEILSAITVRLRTFFKPLFLFHVSSISREGSSSGLPGHQENYKNVIKDELSTKIEEMLVRRGSSTSEAKLSAEVFAGLIIACMHNDDLDMESIASAMKVII